VLRCLLLHGKRWGLDLYGSGRSLRWSRLLLLQLLWLLLLLWLKLLQRTLRFLRLVLWGLSVKLCSNSDLGLLVESLIECDLGLLAARLLSTNGILCLLP
jgi:hypothetical protein